jgi:hypothetical protein
MMQPIISEKKGFYKCPVDNDPAFTLWWVQLYGAAYGIPNPSDVPFPSSYYWSSPFYQVCDAGGNVTNPKPPPFYIPQPHLITQVKYPAQKLMFNCYANAVPGGTHYKDTHMWVFVDGHAAMVRYKEVTPRGTNQGALGPGYVDWTAWGIKGKDIN